MYLVLVISVFSTEIYYLYLDGVVSVFSTEIHYCIVIPITVFVYYKLKLVDAIGKHVFSCLYCCVNDTFCF